MRKETKPENYWQNLITYGFVTVVAIFKRSFRTERAKSCNENLGNHNIVLRYNWLKFNRDYIYIREAFQYTFMQFTGHNIYQLYNYKNRLKKLKVKLITQF